jgi:hypothetical protein
VNELKVNVIALFSTNIFQLRCNKLEHEMPGNTFDGFCDLSLSYAAQECAAAPLDGQHIGRRVSRARLWHQVSRLPMDLCETKSE